jgi:chromate transport protein ChrA
MSVTSATNDPDAATRGSGTLRDILRYFLYLGTFGFGGPIALAGYIAGRVALYFAEAGAFVFGSGLAIVPFLHGGVVNQFHWLNERQLWMPSRSR